ncbi:YitT family protein [Clostridiales bacterium COT073_COT-073]|nr:YitT family protein [Clostridiales bacterium COT073_COT-073]
MIPKFATKTPQSKALWSIGCVLITALLQAFIIETFLEPAQLLPAGFTGVAIILNRVFFEFFQLEISTAFFIVLLNLPVALVCAKTVGKKFTLYSTIEFIAAALFLKWFRFPTIFHDTMLNIIFGGFINGLSIAIALSGNASTGGTDFIALYVANKTGREIWRHVFVFNIVLLAIFGYLFGWEYAGYSILYQFISTKTIETFYQRYKRVTLQITTQFPDKVIKEYLANHRHGISVVNGYGGYSGRDVSLLHIVCSSYEMDASIKTICHADPGVVINVIPSINFYGRFYRPPLE